MKCSEASIGCLGVIELALMDIKNDKSTNTLEQTLDMMAEQIKMIRTLEGLDS